MIRDAARRAGLAAAMLLAAVSAPSAADGPTAEPAAPVVNQAAVRELEQRVRLQDERIRRLEERAELEERRVPYTNIHLSPTLQQWREFLFRGRDDACAP